MFGEAQGFLENLDSTSTTATEICNGSGDITVSRPRPPLCHSWAWGVCVSLPITMPTQMTQQQGYLSGQGHAQLDAIRGCWLCNLSWAYCKKFVQIFTALCYLYCSGVLSWSYSCTTNTEMEFSVWGHQFAVKIPNQGTVKVKQLWRENEAVRGVLWAPVSPRGLLPSPGEMGKFYAVLPHPRYFLNKEHICPFTQPFDSFVHIWLGLISKLDSVKFQLAFGYGRHLDQTASALLKYTQRSNMIVTG